ncbi:MAG: hypothetical protein GDA46_00765 [Bdellovibrionales bacterium]|nr:hypothetical protein [Bdellovibrionales bacterium]
MSGLKKFSFFFFKKNLLNKKEKGIVTIPFLFILIIFLFLILSFLFLNMTLVHVSITQYMSYSSARKLSLSDQSKSEQILSVEKHYRQLRSTFFSPRAYTDGSKDWFELLEFLDSREHIGSNVVSDYPEENLDRQRFYGINLLFISYILKLQIPFLIDSPDRPSIKARVSSFLGREPSVEECAKFYEKKYETIRQKCTDRDLICTFPVPQIKEDDNGC